MKVHGFYGLRNHNKTFDSSKILILPYKPDQTPTKANKKLLIKF